jgi:hypothetical protein
MLLHTVRYRYVAGPLHADSMIRESCSPHTSASFVSRTARRFATLSCGMLVLGIHSATRRTRRQVLSFRDSSFRFFVWHVYRPAVDDSSPGRVSCECIHAVLVEASAARRGLDKSVPCPVLLFPYFPTHRSSCTRNQRIQAIAPLCF